MSIFKLFSKTHQENIRLKEENFKLNLEINCMAGAINRICPEKSLQIRNLVQNTYETIVHNKTAQVSAVVSTISSAKKTYTMDREVEKMASPEDVEKLQKAWNFL